MEGLAARYVVDELNRADFDDAVALGVINSGCLGIENDLAHS
jgi:hypothetical protein